MPSTRSLRLGGLQRLLFVVVCFWCFLLVSWTSLVLPTFQASKSLPFGIFSFTPNGPLYAQDFAYNMLYFQGIHERLVAHPYRLADQESLMRQMLPNCGSGLSHAYSPVAYALALPLLHVSGYHAYLAYIILSSIGIVLLFYFYLLPRAQSPLQIYALAACLLSVCIMITFVVGQSSLITTTFLGAFWGLSRLRSSATTPSILLDLSIAILFWALCLKPSVAVIPVMLLLGAKAWRVLFIGFALLLVTWISLADHYGGLWTGLEDYFYLLNHYHNADFSSFMQRGSETPAQSLYTSRMFALDRNLILLLSTALIVLRWGRRISGSEQFQGMVWIFLLFSPYLLPSEDWILCLLIVEGPFFYSGISFAAAAKLLLVFGILDLRAGLTIPMSVNFPLKCLLFAWIFFELIRRRRTDSEASTKGSS